MTKDLANKLASKKPTSTLFGYKAFINQDKVKFDEPIDIGDDVAEVQSIAMSSDIPEVRSPSLAPSIRATSPVLSIADSNGSRRSVRVIKNSDKENNSGYANRSSSFDIPIKFVPPQASPPRRPPSPTPSNGSRRSHRSERSRRSNNSSTSSVVLPPIYEENTEAKRLLEFQLARRKEKLYNQAKRLQERCGVRFTRQITPDMPIKDLEDELKLAKRNRKIDRDIGFAKSTLVWLTKAIEWTAKQTEVVDLEGWSGELRRDLPEIGEILEEIYEEHEDVINKFGNPWTKLALIWAGGAAKVATANHMTKFAGQQFAKKKKKKNNDDSDDDDSDEDIEPAIDDDLAELMKEADAL